MSAWPVVALGSKVRFLSGGTPRKDEAKYWNGDIPWVGSAEMVQRRIGDTELRVTEEGAREGSKLVPANTVLVVVRGMSLAKEFRVAITERELTFNQDLKALKPADDLDPLFLFYYLLSQNSAIRDSASEAAHGTKKLDTPVLEQWPIPLPPLEVQCRIAAILSAYDDLIANNQRRIALLEFMAEEVYREWFVRMRFPGQQDGRIEKGVPLGWDLVPTKEAFEFFGGATPSKDVARYWKNGTVNWFTPTDITGAAGMFLEGSKEQCSEEGLESCSARLFPSHSVMLTSRATIGAIGINLTPACTNQGFISCIPNERYPLSFLYHWLKLTKPHFELLAGGSTFPELTKGTFKRLQVLTPPAQLVALFDRIVSPQFQAIETLLKANERLKATRDALLPRLISGKLKVDHLDIQLPPSMREKVTA